MTEEQIIESIGLDLSDTPAILTLNQAFVLRDALTELLDKEVSSLVIDSNSYRKYWRHGRWHIEIKGLL